MDVRELLRIIILKEGFIGHARSYIVLNLLQDMNSSLLSYGNHVKANAAEVQ